MENTLSISRPSRGGTPFARHKRMLLPAEVKGRPIKKLLPQRPPSRISAASAISAIPPPARLQTGLPMRLPASSSQACAKPQPNRTQSPLPVLELPRSPHVLNAPDLPSSAPFVRSRGIDPAWASQSLRSQTLAPQQVSESLQTRAQPYAAPKLNPSAPTLNAPMPQSALTQGLVIRRPQVVAASALTLSEPPMSQVQNAREGCEMREKCREESGFASPHDSSSIKNVATHTFTKHTVVFLSASGGVGLSALCSLTALQLRDQGSRTALVDADFDAGGLDILLGLENDKGLRFGTLNAPLGKIDGDVLCRRLPHWEGIPVLAFDSWNSEVPEWWEVQSVLTALEGSAKVDLVLVDGSGGRVIDMVPDLRHASLVVVTELSVLGLARAKTLLKRLSSTRMSPTGRGNSHHFDVFVDSSGSPALSPSQPQSDDFAQDSETGYRDLELRETQQLAAIVGIEPRGASRQRGVVSVNEASEYLGHQVLGPICPNSARISDALEGLGLKIAKSDRVVMTELAHAVSDAVEGGERH